MKDKFFLILSPSEWSDNAVSNMQISSILSKDYEVVYVETIGTRIPKISEWRRIFTRINKFFFSKKTKTSKGLDPLNVKIISPLAIPYHGNFIINKINIILISLQLKKFIKKNNKIYIWSFSPIWENFIETLGPNFRIFHCVDALNTYDSSKKYQTLLEKSLKFSDLIFTPGVLLEKELKEYNSNTFLVGHGCGQNHIEHKFKSLPEDIKNLNQDKKIVVYAGTLANWVDYDLLDYLCKSNKEVIFLIIGYIHSLAPIEKVNNFLKNSNVIHVGYKNYEELPAYYSVASVGIIPYQSDNRHIIYSTPTKFLDYFSAGLQTISTNFPAAHEYDDDFVKIGNSYEDFSKLLKEQLLNLSNSSSEKIKKYAEENSWDNQVQKMLNIIEKVENTKQSTK